MLYFLKGQIPRLLFNKFKGLDKLYLHSPKSENLFMNEFDVVNIIVLVIGIVLFLILVSFSIVSLVEKESKQE